MSAYENVVGGKLKLKGKALDVKSGGMKKKKKNKKRIDQISEVTEEKDKPEGQSSDLPVDADADADANADADQESEKKEEAKAPHIDGLLTPAERRYIEQRERIDVNRLAKLADKSHRDRIEDFNQYLANMSEHYDIPKVGPG